MKLTVEDMNAVVKYMGANGVRNVEVMNDGLLWETSSDIIVISETDGKYRAVKRPLNPPVTELNVMELVGTVDVEEGLERLLEMTRGDMIRLHTCKSGLHLAREGDSFYAWTDKHTTADEKYTFSVPMSEVSLIDDGEYLVGETMSTNQLEQLAEEAEYNG